MAFQKQGTPIKINEVASSDVEFEKMRKKIAEENDLVRCPGCSHLLGKRSADGILDIQHKRAAVLIQKAEKVEIQCPICRQVTGV